MDGILFHSAGPTDAGWRVVDVWESEEAFQRFGEVIGPVLQEVGFPGEPRLFPLHNFVKWSGHTALLDAGGGGGRCSRRGPRR